MSATLIALTGFAAWTLSLVTITLLYRTGLVFTLKKRANSWPRGEKPPADEPGVFTRIGHAYQNCGETLPVFAAIALVASATGRLAITDTVAMYVLYARMAQSITHAIGVTHWLVFIRASFFTVQLLLYAWMIWGLLH